MIKYLLFFFSCTVFSQQLPLDSISYNFFYEKELDEIVQLKKELQTQQFNALKLLQVAEHYESINCEDSAYATFYRVYEHEIVNRKLDRERFKKLLFQLHETESSKHNYKKDRRFFLNLLKQESNHDKDDKWNAKIENEIAKDNLADSSKYRLALEQFKKIQTSNFYNNNEEFKSSILLNIGHTLTNLKQFSNAKIFLEQSLSIALANQDNKHQIYANINLAVNELQQNNFKQALIYLDRIDGIPISQFKIKILRIVYQLKGDAYYGLNDEKKLAICDAYFHKLDSVINDFRNNSNFYEIDLKYQVKEKNKQLKKYSGLENKFRKNKFIYGLLIFGVFLLALYSFIRWKKVDRRKKILAKENARIEEEKENTISELKTVKSLVTKDYIILKNKSKVYLDTLIYVKSDGHYLNLFTEDKKEFVRGKITEVQKQLPPNFVKCHRSYIVNRNFIKQFSSSEVLMNNGVTIPISRNFKF